MTYAKAKVVFATHMQAARKRKLTAYEVNQLNTARQVLRQSRKPAMNAPKLKSADEYWYQKGFDDACLGIRPRNKKKRYVSGYRAGKHYCDTREKYGHPTSRLGMRVEENPKQLTLRQAQAEVRSMGLRLISNPEFNEYIVRIPGRPQADYFTDDLQDAVDTARAMAARKAKGLPNPKRVLIYGEVQTIFAKKTQKHICDDECKKHGHKYFHEFSSKPKMYGLPDGSILIKP